MLPNIKIFLLSIIYLTTGTAAVEVGFRHIGVLPSILIILLSSTVTALLRKSNSFAETLKNWLAGICAGIVITLWLSTAEINITKEILIIIIASGFIGIIYPRLEKWAAKFFDKNKDGTGSI